MSTVGLLQVLQALVSLRNHRAMLEVFEEVQQHAEIHAGTGSHIFTQAGAYQPPDEA